MHYYHHPRAHAPTHPPTHSERLRVPTLRPPRAASAARVASPRRGCGRDNAPAYAGSGGRASTRRGGVPLSSARSSGGSRRRSEVRGAACPPLDRPAAGPRRSANAQYYPSATGPGGGQTRGYEPPSSARGAPPPHSLARARGGGGGGDGSLSERSLSFSPEARVSWCGYRDARPSSSRCSSSSAALLGAATATARRIAPSSSAVAPPAAASESATATPFWISASRPVRWRVAAAGGRCRSRAGRDAAAAVHRGRDGYRGRRDEKVWLIGPETRSPRARVEGPLRDAAAAAAPRQGDVRAADLASATPPAPAAQLRQRCCSRASTERERITPSRGSRLGTARGARGMCGGTRSDGLRGGDDVAIAEDPGRRAETAWPRGGPSRERAVSRGAARGGGEPLRGDARRKGAPRVRARGYLTKRARKRRKWCRVPRREKRPKIRLPRPPRAQLNSSRSSTAPSASRWEPPPRAIARAAPPGAAAPPPSGLAAGRAPRPRPPGGGRRRSRTHGRRGPTRGARRPRPGRVSSPAGRPRSATRSCAAEVQNRGGGRADADRAAMERAVDALVAASLSTPAQTCDRRRLRREHRRRIRPGSRTGATRGRRELDAAASPSSNAGPPPAGPTRRDDRAGGQRGQTFGGNRSQRGRVRTPGSERRRWRSPAMEVDCRGREGPPEPGRARPYLASRATARDRRGIEARARGGGVR